jgi:glyoxylase-like metal-dependent hydrolase (beta-lactamase superfamily II)
VRIGRWDIKSIVDARFALDGGAMFGVVPRPLWAKEIPPDPRHRIPLVARCLVAVDRDAHRVVLVDDGLGDKWEERRADRFGIERTTGGVDAGLAALGLSRTDVTDVLLTHLHLEHAGGTTRRGAAGRLELSFPRATHHVQRRHWLHAHGPTRDGPSYVPDDFELLQHSNQLHLVEGEVALFPDFELIVCEGHTAAQQLPRFHGDGTHLTFCGDVIPTHAHLRPSWVMAYDLFPVTTIEEKKVLLAAALEDDGVLAFEHDTAMAACRLGEENGQPVFRAAVEL